MQVSMYRTALFSCCLVAFSVQAEGDKGTALNAGISLTDGNSETMVANAGILHESGSESTPLKIGLEGNYGETGDETTVENAKAFGSLKHLYSDTFYSYLNLDLLFDDIAGVDSRLTAGPGVGTFIVKSEETELSVEAGAAYIREELDGGDGEDVSDDIAALRLGQALTHALSDTARVWESIEYLPEFEDFDNYLLNSEIGIEADVNETLALRLVYQYRYDATPAPGREEGDSSLIAGFSYKM